MISASERARVETRMIIGLFTTSLSEFLTHKMLTKPPRLRFTKHFSWDIDWSLLLSATINLSFGFNKLGPRSWYMTEPLLVSRLGWHAGPCRIITPISSKQSAWTPPSRYEIWSSAFQIITFIRHGYQTRSDRRRWLLGLPGHCTYSENRGVILEHMETQQRGYIWVVHCTLREKRDGILEHSL